MNAQQARELQAAAQKKNEAKVYSTIEAMAKAGKSYATFDIVLSQEFKDKLMSDGYTIEIVGGYVTVNW